MIMTSNDKDKVFDIRNYGKDNVFDLLKFRSSNK